MSSNRRQHVVPQFFLRHFVASDGMLRCLSIAEGKIFSTGPDNVAHERDAFSITRGEDRDNSFDKINNNVEVFCAPKFVSLSSGNLDQDVISGIGAFSSNMIMRSRTQRDNNLDSMGRIVEVLRNMSQKLTGPAQNDPVLERFGPKEKWDLSANANAIEKAAELTFPISQVMLDPVAKRLSGRRLIILRAPPGKSFIANDDPVCFLKGLTPIENRRGPLPLLDDIEVGVLIPLLPSIACLWQHGPPEIREEVLTSEMVDVYNKLIATTAYMQIFASSEVLLREVAQSCGIKIPAAT